jgi:hypothetical protein
MSLKKKARGISPSHSRTPSLNQEQHPLEQVTTNVSMMAGQMMCRNTLALVCARLDMATCYLSVGGVVVRRLSVRKRKAFPPPKKSNVEKARFGRAKRQLPVSISSPVSF